MRSVFQGVRRANIGRLLRLIGCVQLLLATSSAFAEARPALSAAVESRGGAVLADNMEILSEIGSFEAFRVLSGQRAITARGPSISTRDRIAMAESFGLERAESGSSYKYDLRWVTPNTLRVKLAFRAPAGWPSGIEFCIGKLSAELFVGSTVTSGTFRSKLPAVPLAFEKRHLLRDRSFVSIASSIVDVKIISGDGAISIADFRRVPWDARRSFYLHSTRTVILPQQTVTFSYDLVFSGPTLTTSQQFGDSTGVRGVSAGVGAGAGERFFRIDLKRRPEVPVRGVLTELLPPARKDVALFKGYLRAISKSGGNTLVLYHMPEHVLALRRGIVPEQTWNRQELLEVADYARALGIEVIPGMSSKFHAKQFPLLSGGRENGFYDTFDEGSYREVFALYATLLEIYHPKALLIGHDEIVGVGRNRPAAWTDAQALASDVRKVSGWLRDRGVKTLMFGDMLLDSRRWGSPLIANSNIPLFGSTDTHDALDALPRDIVILDWQYWDSNDYQTVQHFKRKGFTVWGVAWHSATAAVSLARSVRRYGADGILASDWGFWATLSPSAVSLYAVKAGYDSSTKVQEDGEDAVLAMAGEMRGQAAVQHDGYSPIPLHANASRATQSVAAQARRDFVRPNLDTVPVGRSNLAGVTFEVSGSSEGGLAEYIRVTGPEQLAISLGGKRSAGLAFLHAMWQAQPRVQPRNVGAYELIYQDGQRERVELLENYNITDLRSGPGVRANPWTFASSADVLLGSVLGWRGRSRSGTLVNLQVLTWTNPRVTAALDRIVLKPNLGTTLVLVALSGKAPKELNAPLERDP